MFDTGFVWNDLTTIVAIICALVIIAALVLLFVFGKKQHQLTDGLELIEFFQAYPHAVVGSFFRGPQKEVGAQEYISTLMALVHEGVISIVNMKDEKRLGLSLKDASNWDISCPIDSSALSLLNDYYAEDGVVYLASAKERGEKNKEGIDTAYRNWRKLVAAEAKGSLSTKKVVQNISTLLLYGGYAFILIGVITGLFVNMTIMTLLLLTGFALIIIREFLQRNTNVEKGSARRLYLWLSKIESYTYRVSENMQIIPLLLEYACLFSLADNLSKTLSGQINSCTHEEVEFWKRLRGALYTDDWHF